MGDVARSLRHDAETILRAAIAGAAPAPRVAAALARAPELAAARRIFLLAFGKAAVAMAEAALATLGARVTAGLVVAPHGTAPPAPGALRFLTAAHPIPDEHSVTAARAAHELLASAGTDDLVLALISGGGSSLLVEPAPGLTLADVARTTRELQLAGADIHALNAVRRRIDLVKAGRLAALAAPAPVLCLAISDVPGDDPAIIASGPFTPDVAAPPAGNVRYEIVAANADARAAAATAAQELGYRASPGAFPLGGEARACGERVAAAALAAEPGSAIVYGGETTVTVRGAGTGGRNQELTLAAALRIAGTTGIAIGCVGTDGVDGRSPAAGAIVEGSTAARLAAAGIDAAAALAANDSHTALSAAGAVLVTGPTGTNVMDVGIVLRAGGAGRKRKRPANRAGRSFERHRSEGRHAGSTMMVEIESAACMSRSTERCAMAPTSSAHMTASTAQPIE
jgi:glycerate-2-kinase